MANDIRRKYEERRPLLEEAARLLEQNTGESLSDYGHIDRICFRVKGTEGFANKVEKSKKANDAYDDPLVEIEDQIAGRVIVFFLQDLTDVEHRLRQVYTTVEATHKQPPKDEEFGYESQHLICLIPPQVQPSGWSSRKDVPKTFELQLRTLFMHAWAEPQHHLAYKGASDLPKEIRRELAWIAASAWGADQAYKRVWDWQGSGSDGNENAVERHFRDLRGEGQAW